MSERSLVMLALIGAITLGFIVTQLRGCAEINDLRWAEYYKGQHRKEALSDGKR